MGEQYDLLDTKMPLMRKGMEAQRQLPAQKGIHKALSLLSILQKEYLP